jgi:hypothetical protein
LKTTIIQPVPNEIIESLQKAYGSTQWKQYKRKGLSEMRPWAAGDDMASISVSEADKLNGSPKIGDMIARNPKNYADQWLVAKKYFLDNLEPV